MDPAFNERFANEDTTRNVVVNTVATVSIFSIFAWIWLSVLALIWFFAGIAAFFASLVCMFYNSSIADKVVGFLLALFFGPLYWGFYIYKASYCTKYNTANYYYE